MRNGFNSLEYFKDESLILDNLNYISNIKDRSINFLNHRKPKAMPAKMFKL